MRLQFCRCYRCYIRYVLTYYKFHSANEKFQFDFLFFRLIYKNQGEQRQKRCWQWQSVNQTLASDMRMQFCRCYYGSISCLPMNHTYYCKFHSAHGNCGFFKERLCLVIQCCCIVYSIRNREGTDLHPHKSKMQQFTMKTIDRSHKRIF